MNNIHFKICQDKMTTTNLVETAAIDSAGHINRSGRNAIDVVLLQAFLGIKTTDGHGGRQSGRNNDCYQIQ